MVKVITGAKHFVFIVNSFGCVECENSIFAESEGRVWRLRRQLSRCEERSNLIGAKSRESVRKQSFRMIQYKSSSCQSLFLIEMSAASANTFLFRKDGASATRLFVIKISKTTFQSNRQCFHFILKHGSQIQQEVFLLDAGKDGRV